KESGCPSVVRLLKAHLKEYPNGIKPSTSKVAMLPSKSKSHAEQKKSSVSGRFVNDKFPKRRESETLNFEDKKEEQEKIRYVLEELRTFFREDRDEGEKTKNYAVYNEYLKKVHHDAQLAHSAKQNRHILYVDDSPLDAGSAINELSKILKSLTAATVPQKPLVSTLITPQPSVSVSPLPLSTSQATFPVVALVQKPNISEQKSSADTLIGFKEFVKSTFRINVSDFPAFLQFVAEGEQDKAEAILKSNPNLVLLSGDVIDLSKRTFTGITGFQYAVWALDWHMWTMIRKYLPDELAWEQAQECETGPWVRHHGTHAQHILDNLIRALQVTIDLYNPKKNSEGDAAWVQQVGGAQLLLPAHVMNEYC
ncbi:MAG TPA: hypothetical protein PK583_06035, partial [Gammaproteobacteria bacterium]|nr:hypothetical protein [Gammaproteobacteria bacterium]